MLVLISASSYALVSKLNSASKLYTRQQQSSDALAEAKQALISYAATYPDRVNSNFGPGYLPCPDRDNDGSTDAGACASASNTTIGRLPWVTLRLNDLRDSSGQRLWYVLSDNYRNNPKLEPLNSETAGQLNFDIDADDDIDASDVDDIVAIIIAPGEPIVTGAGVTQSRDPSETDILVEISQYLEGDNIDFDTNFVNASAANVNDRLVYITRKELMQQVEKRVLGETNQILSNYFNTYGAYPWLSEFADPKTNPKRLFGTHTGSDNQSGALTDTNANFTQWGVANGDVVWNMSDNSYGIVTAVSATTLTIGGGLTGLASATDNDFDVDDTYYVDVEAVATAYIGTVTASDSLVLTDNTKDFTALGVEVGDIVENLSDASSGIIEDVDTTTLTVKALTGGASNTFTIADSYQIRINMGRATADTDANGLTLDNTSVNFTIMGVVEGDLIRNITDGSYGRITAVSANRITVDELLYGSDNTFALNDYYSIPRLNGEENVSEGLLAIHEVAEPFKTEVDFTWAFTANAADITVTDSNLLLTYMNNLVTAGNRSFDDSTGTCIWFNINYADCYGYFKDFVNISGFDTSSSNSNSIRDTSATFITDGVKRGDIAQNYDDEISVISGTVDAGNSGSATAGSSNSVLEDTNNNFINADVVIGDTVFNVTDGSSGTVTSVTAAQITAVLSGGTDNIFENGDDYRVGNEPTLYDASANFSIYERYSYVIQNNTLEGELGESKIQGVISDTIGTDTLEAEAYVGEGTVAIEFRPGDSYQIYQPRRFFVETVNSETRVTADNYTSSTNPDFDQDEYYRIMPAGNSQNARVDSKFEAGGIAYFDDTSATFVTDGVEIGDIVENDVGAYGEIVFLTETRIGATLYGGSFQDFWAGAQYTVYYNYIFSREHIFHARFSGNSRANTVAEERKREVCLGYNADCSAISAAVNFFGNGNQPLFSVTDYQEDEITTVGNVTFTPSNLSTGSLLLSNIDYLLNESSNDFPAWFVNNDWHKLTYVAVSPGDEPGAAINCSAGSNCLTANIVKSGATTPNDDVNALVIAAGSEIDAKLDSTCLVALAAEQDRTNGTINEYFELENCDAADNIFQKQAEADNYNDQILIIATTP